MYVPPHNRNQDRVQQLDFMRQYNFAALVTAGRGLCATHLPFLVEERGGSLHLCAHLAAANPQAEEIRQGAQALVIFQGPHAYVSPSLYQRHPSVPTWNYAAVHASGPLRLLESRDQKLDLLRRLAAAHDPPYLEAMARLPEEFLQLKLGGIAAFEIAVERLEARWKLSQDRSPAERSSIVAALEAGSDTDAAALARMMRDSGA